MAVMYGPETEEMTGAPGALMWGRVPRGVSPKLGNEAGEPGVEGVATYGVSEPRTGTVERVHIAPTAIIPSPQQRSLMVSWFENAGAVASPQDIIINAEETWQSTVAPAGEETRKPTW